MKPPPFAYAEPRSVPEALEALAQYGEDGKILAGGQSLVPLLNMRLAQPQVLIDLNRVPELAFLEMREREGRGGLACGAMTRQRSVEDARELHDRLPMLAQGISWVGHPQIRNRGTVGGSIAHADPAAELPLVFLVLDGAATIQSRNGTRTVPAEQFFVYTFTTNLDPDEMLTEVWFPLPHPRTGHAFVEVARRHGDFALVAAAATVTLDHHGTCINSRIALGGTAPTPIRAREAEDAIVGQRVSLKLFREAGEIAMRELQPTADVHADAEYRREVAGTLVTRALTQAFERVPRGDA